MIRVPRKLEAIVADLRAVVLALTPGVPCDPRQCTQCGRATTWLNTTQLTVWRAAGHVPCTRFGCAGLMRRLDDPAGAAQ